MENKDKVLFSDLIRQGVLESLAREDREHSVWAPSSAQTWLRCPSSAPLSAYLQDAGKYRSTIDQKMGTVAHETAAALLPRFLAEDIDQVTPEDVIPLWTRVVGRPGKDSVLRSIAQAVEEYLRAIRAVTARMGLGPDQIFFEERVVAPEEVYGKGVFGTLDFYAVSEDQKKIVAADLKYGTYQVSPFSPQLKFYLVLLAEKLGWPHGANYYALIVQPRVPEPISWTYYTSEFLREFRDKLVLPAIRAGRQEPMEHFVEGEQCRLCNASAYCPRMVGLWQEALDLMPAELTKPLRKQELDLSDPETLGRILKLEEAAKDVFKQARSNALDLLLRGKKIPGYKLVRRRKNRRWKDELVAAQSLEEIGLDEEKIYRKTLISPAQAEKLVGRKRLLAHLIERPLGEPTIAPEYDKRPELSPGEVDEEMLDFFSDEIQGKPE